MVHWAHPVTGQLADTPTRGLPTRGLDVSRTGQLVDWTTRGYRLSGQKVTYLITYARKSINKWLNSNIQLHFIMKPI